LPSTELRAAIPRAPSRRRVARLEENPAPAPTASPPRVAPRLTPAEIPSAEVCIVSAATWSPSIGTQGQTMPKLLSNPPPIYPVEAVRDGWEGTVLLRLYVNADGSVARVEVISSSEHGILDAAAVDGVGNWHFEPARRFGHPVACTVCQPVRFSLP